MQNTNPNSSLLNGPIPTIKPAYLTGKETVLITNFSEVLTNYLASYIQNDKSI